VVHSGPEPERHSFNAVTGRRDLLETYLPAFEMTVREAGVQSVMCAYNRTNGEICCGSDYLLSGLLRDSLGFEGYIVSDCGAVNDFYNGHNIVKTRPEAAAMAVRAGTDLNCGNSYEGLVEAVKLGLISEAEIDISLKRFMKARFMLGMFDPDEMVPFSKIPLDIVECDEHRSLAEQTARESMVLLKNEGNLLPLDKNIRKLAVIGPNANDTEVMYGNYNGFSKNPVTPLEGIRKKIPGAEILYARGCDIAENMPALEVIPGELLFTTREMKENGLVGEYYNNNNLEGQPFLRRVDNKIEFNWWDETPAEGLQDNRFSIRWSGYLLAPETGEYCIGGEGIYKYTLDFNGEQIVKFSSIHHPLKVYKKIKLEKGKLYAVRIEFTDTKGMALMNLLWKLPQKDLKKEALEAAI
jgi:beta-glucosidase